MQQQPMNQQGQIMPEPPPILTNKDLLYISDMLSWNLLAMKKAHEFAQQCNDQQVSQAIDAAGKMHQQHYQTILTHLQDQTTQQGSSTLQ